MHGICFLPSLQVYYYHSFLLLTSALHVCMLAFLPIYPSPEIFYYSCNEFVIFLLLECSKNHKNSISRLWEFSCWRMQYSTGRTFKIVILLMPSTNPLSFLDELWLGLFPSPELEGDFAANNFKASTIFWPHGGHAIILIQLLDEWRENNEK